MARQEQREQERERQGRERREQQKQSKGARQAAFDILTGRIGRFLASFFGLWVALAALLAYARVLVAEKPPLDWPEIVIIVLIAMASMVGVAFPLAFGFVEGLPMVLAKMYTDRVRAEAREEALDEVRDEVWDEAWGEAWEEARAEVDEAQAKAEAARAEAAAARAEVEAARAERRQEEIRAVVREEVRAALHEEARAAVREGSRAEGRQEGALLMLARWREWNRRRRAADEAGLPFNEPEPDMD